MLKSFKLLIVGDVRRGKTTLTSKLVEALAEVCGDNKITVLDFAPDFKGIGSKITVSNGVKVLRPNGIKAPRLMGRDCRDIWDLAKNNRELTEATIREYLKAPTPILVINDVSIYLHDGDLSILLEAAEKAVIFVANSYYGHTLKDNCGLSEVERVKVEELMKEMDYVWRL
ncbi:MAG: hypothetical protein N3G48_05725 [Sulfolobales archaeon]|nr:hypothetical protein [Sulfolobales archaeon]